VKLTVVGCAPAWTRRSGRASSCYLVEHADAALLLDLGQGAFSELARYRDPARLDAVLVSHLHPDHYIDLVPLRHYLKYEATDARPPVLRGPADLGARLESLFPGSHFLADFPGKPLAPGRFELAGFEIEARHVTHIADAFAIRLAPAKGDGPGLVYSGDCSVADDLVPLIRAGDTLLSEAFHGADAQPTETVHINAEQAAWAAAEVQAARLVLTHLSDRSDPAAARAAAATAFKGDIFLAEPGLTLDMG
jgi:ribonuclease BN (tRNA processing enzyme)